METNKILNADILDIIFDGRNKDYGAYELRKTYNTRLRNSMLGTGGLCLLLFLGYMLSNIQAGKKKAQMVVQDFQLEEVQQKKDEPPPPPPPKVEPPKIEMAKFTPPKIVKDEEVKK